MATASLTTTVMRQNVGLLGDEGHLRRLGAQRSWLDVDRYRGRHRSISAGRAQRPSSPASAQITPDPWPNDYGLLALPPPKYSSGQVRHGETDPTTPKLYGGSTITSRLMMNPVWISHSVHWVGVGRIARSGPRGVGTSLRQWMTPTRPPGRKAECAARSRSSGASQCRILNSNTASAVPVETPNDPQVMSCTWART